MIGFVIAFLVTIVLAVYGWGTFFSLRKKRKSIRTARPFTHEEKCTTIINEPNKEKCDRTNSGKS